MTCTFARQGAENADRLSLTESLAFREHPMAITQSACCRTPVQGEVASRMDQGTDHTIWALWESLHASVPGQAYCGQCLADDLGATSIAKRGEVMKALQALHTRFSERFELYRSECAKHKASGPCWIIRRRLPPKEANTHNVNRCSEPPSSGIADRLPPSGTAEDARSRVKAEPDPGSTGPDRWGRRWVCLTVSVILTILVAGGLVAYHDLKTLGLSRAQASHAGPQAVRPVADERTALAVVPAPRPLATVPEPSGGPSTASGTNLVFPSPEQLAPPLNPQSVTSTSEPPVARRPSTETKTVQQSPEPRTPALERPVRRVPASRSASGPAQPRESSAADNDPGAVIDWLLQHRQ